MENHFEVTKSMGKFVGKFSQFFFTICLVGEEKNSEKKMQRIENKNKNIF